MKKFHLLFLVLLLARLACAAPSTPAVAAPAKAPFPYVWGKAFHILPETHTDESGYFSIIEGKDGKIYVGTAKYDYNAFLVEFDPKTQTQKIVIDTNKVNGLTATGYASQSKIHTRNFVGPSGKIYCGSQEGYRRIPGDVSVYPGGYVMVYDPKTQTAQSLGMPMKGEGVIDVVADEARGLLYVVTSWGEDNKAHWMISGIDGKSWRDLGVLPTNYASTLIDEYGKAHVITNDFQLATYDPDTQKITALDIEMRGAKWKQTDGSAIPTWQLAPDKNAAYLILMDDPTLFKINFDGAEKVRGEVLGRMIEGTGYDSRASLTVAPDGRVYALEKVNNETKFGDGYLHHLTRYDPRTKATQDLGVLAVRNPDFFNFAPDAAGNKPPWSHGYHTLPDGTMTPLHGHQGLVATQSGDLYALILYPFTLLKMEGAAAPARAVSTPIAARANTKTRIRNAAPVTASFSLPKLASPSKQYSDFALRSCDNVEKNLNEITRVAEVVAERHLQGGVIDFPWNGQGLQQELSGRAGGLMNSIAGWQSRAPEMDKYNVAVVGWDRAPGNAELGALQSLHDKGIYVIGFGPRDLPELKEHVKLCDAFFDTGLGKDDRVVQIQGFGRAGRGNLLVNMLNGWAFTGEFIAALTRKGKMPTMWKGFLLAGGHEWMDMYYRKSQFHDDFQIAPIEKGNLARAYLNEIRREIKLFHDTQSTHVTRAADMILEEHNLGRNTVLATQGHAPYTYAGKYEDADWSLPFDFDGGVPQQVEAYAKAPDGALVLRLGYSGLNVKEAEIFKQKNQRVILITCTGDTREDYKIPAGLPLVIDASWPYGDAAVSIPNYPIKVLPPSGVMQIVAYESVNTEVLARLPKANTSR